MTLKRALFATLALVGISMSTGCCGPCGGGACGTCGPCSWYPGKHLLGLFGCHGCGPGPRSAWNYDSDPCDCHGNWTGDGYGAHYGAGYPGIPTPIAEPTPTPPPLPPAAAGGASTRLKPSGKSIRPVSYRNPNSAYGPPQGYDPRGYWSGQNSYGPASYGYPPAGYSPYPPQPTSSNTPKCACGRH